MTASTAVAPTGSSLPALANTPALEIDSADITLPRIRIAHGQSSAVEEKLVAAGDLFAGSGADDPDPVVLYAAKDIGTDKPGLLFHVLNLRKGKSMTDEDGELQTWSFHDTDAPPEARTTYDYTVVLPEVDQDVPYKMLLAKSSTAAAKIINTVLAKNQERGGPQLLAFRAKTAERSTTKGTKTYKYHVARITQVEAKDEHVALADKLAVIVAGSQVEAAPSAKPAI